MHRMVGSMQGKEQVLSLVCGWSLDSKLQELLAHIWEERAHSLRKHIDSCGKGGRERGGWGRDEMGTARIVLM